VLSERVRCSAVFEAPEPLPFLWRGLLDESVFLTKEDALNHLWHSELRSRFMEQETVEADPPKGSFTSVARCGLSGEWLGPPNFHAYQTTLRRFHRERFAHVAFETYSAKVRVEKNEEAVAAWLATMTTKTRWRLLPEGAWIEDEALAKRELATHGFDSAFEEARCIEVNAGIPTSHISPALMVSLRQAGNHAKNHPAYLIPSVCKALESEHLPVFKRQGKLYTGPARPQSLPANQILAERPSIMVEWIRANTPAKLEGLWQAVSPDGSGAPPAEYAADLFWLLQQGHILLFPDDTLMLQEARPPAGPGSSDTPASSGKKKKKRKPKSDAPSPVDAEVPAASAPSTTDGSEDPPVVESNPTSEVIQAAEANLAPEDTCAPAAAALEATPENQTCREEITSSASPGVDESPTM
jgi:hypothetical protein